MSLKFIILGALNEHPRTGYQLHKHFERVLNSFWTTDQRQVYYTLHTLHNKDLVDIKVVPQENTADQKIYFVTKKGYEALQAWLVKKLPYMPARFDWLSQLYLGSALDTEHHIQLVEHRIELLEKRVINLQEHLRIFENCFDEQAHDYRGNTYRLITLHYGIRRVTTELLWLRTKLDDLYRLQDIEAYPSVGRELMAEMREMIDAVAS